jgi:hypothetical protein
MSKREAPFTDREVDSINRFQRSSVFHEFTCVEDHDQDRTLVADNDGLRCPHCAYTQNWAYSWMADGSWANSPLLLMYQR